MINDSIFHLSHIFAELCSINGVLYKGAISQEEATYSSLIRQVGKKFPPATLKEFRIIYKDAFDQALIDGDDEPEKIALDIAIKFIDELELK